MSVTSRSRRRGTHFVAVEGRLTGAESFLDVLFRAWTRRCVLHSPFRRREIPNSECPVQRTRDKAFAVRRESDTAISHIRSGWTHLYTESLCPLSRSTCCPVVTFQTRTIVSKDPAATSFPSGDTDNQHESDAASLTCYRSNTRINRSMLVMDEILDPKIENALPLFDIPNPR